MNRLREVITAHFEQKRLESLLHEGADRTSTKPPVADTQEEAADTYFMVTPGTIASFIAACSAGRRNYIPQFFKNTLDQPVDYIKIRQVALDTKAITEEQKVTLRASVAPRFENFTQSGANRLFDLGYCLFVHLLNEQGTNPLPLNFIRPAQNLPVVASGSMSIFLNQVNEHAQTHQPYIYEDVIHGEIGAQLLEHSKHPNVYARTNRQRMLTFGVGYASLQLHAAYETVVAAIIQDRQAAEPSNTNLPLHPPQE